SPNSEGACPNCGGAGVVYTDLALMAGVATTCEVCEGRRFQAEVLEYRLAGKDISQVLEMPVSEALEFFRHRRGAHPGRARDPQATGGRGPGVRGPRPAADHALRRRAPAPEAGHPHGRRGRRLRPRRADLRPA